MSDPNVDVVRRAASAMNDADIDALLAETSADVVLDWSNSIGPLHGVYRGHEGVRRLFEQFIEAWEEFHWHVQEVIEVPPDRVIVVNRVRGRGRGSGVEVDATGAQLWTLRDGRATQIQLHQSRGRCPPRRRRGSGAAAGLG
jgi:ketosteroid isomerase-like protein